MAPAKKRRIARETMEVYVPIAHRLGLNNIYRELQDLSFSHLYPLRYRTLAKAVKAARGNRREVVKKILDAVKNTLAAAGIQAEVYGREKTLYGIYKKMRSKHLSFSQVLDVYGFRVVVDSFANCYVALGTLHAPVQADAGQVQGLHRDPQAQRLPVAAHHADRPLRHAGRIPDPHPGHAPHRRIGRGRALAVQERRPNMSDLQQRTHAWLQSLLDIQQQTGDSAEFLEHVKVDLFPTRSTCSRRSRRSSRCRAAPPRSTSPTRSTPASATIRWRSRSTTRPPAAHRAAQRRHRRDRHRRRTRARARPGWPLSAPARRARRSATTCAPST
jgi:guanosine-3',5'-bis(diphosphate) 3'-pyrophosphohydrolase